MKVSFSTSPKTDKIFDSIVERELFYHFAANDKEREAEYFFVVDHEGEQFVEIKITGTMREWIEHYPLHEFQAKNPMIMLMKKPEILGNN